MVKNPGKKQQHSNRLDQPGAQHGSTGEELAAINQTLKAFDEKREKEKDAADGRAKKQFCLEIAVAAGVGIYTLITLGLFVTALIQIGKSSDQIRVMQDTEQKQLRAYVGVIPGSIENIGDADKQTWTATRKNYGTTPAYDVTLIAFGQSIIHKGEPIPAPNMPPPQDVKGTITLFPSAKLVFHIHGLVIDKGRVAQLMASDDFQMVYFGTVEYHDIFGNRHFTYFCWMYTRSETGSGDADGCLGHNDSD